MKDLPELFPLLDCRSEEARREKIYQDDKIQTN